MKSRNPKPRQACTRMYWIAAALFISIAAVGYIPPLLLDQPLGTSLLIAPLGASALLMLLRPHSRYARPWTVIVANTMAAFIGLITPLWISAPILASAASLALTVAAMGLLRAIHPPSAGIALLATSLGPQTPVTGMHFLVANVMLSSVVLVAVSLLLNKLGGGFIAARHGRARVEKASTHKH